MHGYVANQAGTLTVSEQFEPDQGEMYTDRPLSGLTTYTHLRTINRSTTTA